jgi:hypothetical protein
MELIRTLADTRTHAIYGLYCYLRDSMMAKSWYCTAIQQKRNVAMVTGGTPRNKDLFPPTPPDSPSSSDDRPTGMAALCCMKCHTCLHTGEPGSVPGRINRTTMLVKPEQKPSRTLLPGIPLEAPATVDEAVPSPTRPIKPPTNSPFKRNNEPSCFHSRLAPITIGNDLFL